MEDQHNTAGEVKGAHKGCTEIWENNSRHGEPVYAYDDKGLFQIEKRSHEILWQDFISIRDLSGQRNLQVHFLLRKVEINN